VLDGDGGDPCVLAAGERLVRVFGEVGELAEVVVEGVKGVGMPDVNQSLQCGGRDIPGEDDAVLDALVNELCFE
jgi:hypothetical protein